MTRATAEQLDAAVRPEPADAEPAPTRDEAPQPRSETALVESEMLVEDVSIDGMCGVY